MKHRMALILHTALLDTCQYVTSSRGSLFFQCFDLGWLSCLYSGNLSQTPYLMFVVVFAFFLSFFFLISFFLSFNCICLASKLCLLLFTSRASLVSVRQDTFMLKEMQCLFNLRCFYETELLNVLGLFWYLNHSPKVVISLFYSVCGFPSCFQSYVHWELLCKRVISLRSLFYTER